ncbi:MAG: ATP-binding protein [Bacteroidetes bacterium]|nr:MAG: ATP-binding protein [Bacteroidota bacterium]
MEELFVNRQREREQLEFEYQRAKSAFLILIGRRRMGKTSLLHHFTKNKKNVLYYYSDKDTESTQINKFKNMIAAWSGDTLMNNIAFTHWDEAFEYLIQKIPQNERVVLIIDEFQFLAMANEALPSILQRIWDMKLKSKNLMLVLCGSHISMMYKTTLTYGSPLYGRRTASMKLGGIAFEYLHEFFPKGTSLKTLVECYAMTAGIPKYIEILNVSKNMFENIEKLILTKDSFFYTEPRYILGEELKEQVMNFAVLRAISNGHVKSGDIAASINMASNSITPYLEQLREIELIEKRVPVTEAMPEKSRKGIYVLKDQMIRFWFKYVYQYTSYLEINNRAWVMEKVKVEWNQYVSVAFEEICRNITPYYCPFVPIKVGGWWDKNEEIDICAINPETKEILLGECKWTESKIGVEVYSELTRKAKLVDWNTNNRKEYFMICAKNGFSNSLLELAKEQSNIVLIDFSGELKEMYAGNR